MRKTLVIFSIILSFVWTANTYAQNSEERFQDIFITAGYATAFGAALGAAALGLQQNPEENLNYIAVGASLGFIGGSVMGAYMVFTPVMADVVNSSPSLMASNLRPRTLYIRPHINRQSKVSAIEGAMTLLNF